MTVVVKNKWDLINARLYTFLSEWQNLSCLIIKWLAQDIVKKRSIKPFLGSEKASFNEESEFMSGKVGIVKLNLEWEMSSPDR